LHTGVVSSLHLLVFQEEHERAGGAGEQIAAHSNVAGVFGRSLAVRVNTYIALPTAKTWLLFAAATWVTSLEAASPMTSIVVDSQDWMAVLTGR
jgi:hypothetical protein